MPPLKPETSKSARSALGAPSQHNQPSRKGKKAWRKNVDLQEVEAGIEELRAEERATGTFLHKQQDDQLFVVDVKGDEKIRTKLPKFKSSELTSTKILAQRSAVPAVTSRPAVKKRKSPLSYEDKDRLLRISKRPRKGPFNSVVDPTEFGAGSAAFELTEAVKSSGAYDPWAPAGPVEEIKDGLETVQPKKVKIPAHAHPRHKIEVPAILEPHQGTSYNPPADAHQELLLKAHGIEEKRVEKAAKLAETKEKIDQATVEAGDETPGVPPGMKLDEPVPIDIDEDEDSAEVISKKMPERKTKAQRNKAARVLAQKRALAEKARKKSETALINSGVSLLRRTANKTLSARAIAQEARRAAVEENLKRRGLAGQKLGRHTVPEGEVDVQLGEDLSESLRGLKPEGNLFRDRFTSLQQRALIEPRVPVIPKRRKLRIIEYEKHAWKRFDRE
ncbi:ribosome biogenesis protein Nop53/GLTSCR2 [Mycena albidolilacea]|uniref:Ribosome biogenesis protein NOP53 n=1 Tax=Mycena albidolilacea TaxID=1033008 RepID=A0AAD6ZF25_9AGAR|nr:ribosome biogenesis protein Nop53/GLTSCR2 [Mycena albidolilacea]